MLYPENRISLLTESLKKPALLRALVRNSQMRRLLDQHQGWCFDDLLQCLKVLRPNSAVDGTVVAG